MAILGNVAQRVCIRQVRQGKGIDLSSLHKAKTNVLLLYFLNVKTLFWRDCLKVQNFQFISKCPIGYTPCWQ